MKQALSDNQVLANHHANKADNHQRSATQLRAKLAQQEKLVRHHEDKANGYQARHDAEVTKNDTSILAQKIVQVLAAIQFTMLYPKATAKLNGHFAEMLAGQTKSSDFISWTLDADNVIRFISTYGTAEFYSDDNGKTISKVVVSENGKPQVTYTEDLN